MLSLLQRIGKTSDAINKDSFGTAFLKQSHIGLFFNLVSKLSFFP